MRYLDQGRQLEVAQGTVLYEVGSQPSEDGVFLIVSGRVGLTRHFPDGAEMNLVVEPGGIFGLVDTFTGQPRVFSATALEGCSLYAWSLDGFERVISIYIELAEIAVTALSRQLRQANESMKALS